MAGNESGSHGGVLVNSRQFEVIDQLTNAESIVDCHFLFQIDVLLQVKNHNLTENLHSGFKSVFLINILCLALNSVFSEITFYSFGKS